MGYRIPFLSHPPLSPVPIPMPSYSPLSTKGVALEEVTLGLVTKRAVELAPLPSPGFYSRLFVMRKTSGSWHPVIDLSTLNRFVDVSHFQMETIQSVLLSVRQGNWMASIYLREAYLQVPVHPESRPILRFVSNGHVYQFKALCFGLSTAPQVFSRVMAPVSAILHSVGIHMCRYLDDWLVQSFSRESLLRDLKDSPRALPRAGRGDQPGEIPPHSIPGGTVSQCGDQRPVFCGFSVARSHFQAAINCRRISVLCLASRELMAVSAGDAFFSSLAHLVPGGRLRMRSLQLCLNRSWNHVDLSLPVAWSTECLQDLQWWLHLPRLSQGVSLRQVSPDLDFWSDASDVGWGAHLGPLVASGLWDLEQASLSINARELLAIQHGLLHFQSSLRGADGRGLLRQRHCSGVSLQGGRHQISLAEHHCSGDPALVGVSSHPSGSSIPPELQQCPGGRSVSPSPAAAFRVVPQHDCVSIFVSSVAVADRFVCDLRKSPLLDLFFSLPRPSVCGHGRLPPVLGRSSGLRLSSVCHHSQSPCETLGVSGDRAHPCGSALGTAPLVSGPPPAVAGPSGHPPKIVPTSCSCLDLGSATRVSTGYGFMPGDSPAVHQSCRFLLCGSGAIFLGTPSIFARCLPAPMVCLQVLVPFSWPFSLSPFSGKGGSFSELVAVCQRP